MTPLSMRTQVVLLLVVAIVVAGAWFGRGEIAEAISFGSQTGGSAGDTRPGRDGQRPLPVIVARVGELTNDETLVAVGTAKARSSVMLYSEVEGIVVAVDVSPGDRVRRGETVVKLDRTKAELGVDLARRRLELAERTLERANFLQREQVRSDAGVEDAATSLELARIELRQAEETLRDMTMVAPFDGVAGIPLIDAGERITTSTQIVTLDDRSELLVEFQVPERYISRIERGTPIEAVTPSFPQRTFTGHIEYIDARFDATSRTVMVQAVIPNEEDLLRPGMSFAVEATLAGDTYSAVPQLALQWRDGTSFVWIASGDAVRRVDVSTVMRLNALTLVAGDIAPGDLVVVEGVQRLRPDRTVTYEMPEAPAEPVASQEAE